MQSKYSSGKQVSAAQWAAEILCERRAKTLEIDLPDKFWRLPEWQAFYNSQIYTAHSIVKKYSESALIAAINNNDLKWCYSLRTKKLQKFISEFSGLENTANPKSLGAVKIDKIAKIGKQPQNSGGLLEELG